MKEDSLNNEDRVVFESAVRMRLQNLNKRVEEQETAATYNDGLVEVHQRRASKARTLVLVYTLERDALRAQLSEPIKGGGVEHY